MLYVRLDVVFCKHFGTCCVYTRGMLCGGGLLVLNLTSVLIVSLSRFPKCVWIFERVRGGGCCDS